ncbi:MAG: hypothetical protein II404_09565 [Prevotella sp.]|nr:hypothetical protein [Prevotella sp.]
MYSNLFRIIEKTEPVYRKGAGVPDPTGLWYSRLTLSTTEFEEAERDVISAETWDWIANKEVRAGDVVFCSIRFCTDGSKHLGAEVIDIKDINDIIDSI